MILDTKPTDKFDIGSIHDALTEIDDFRDTEFTDDQIQRITELLPKDTHAFAARWGWDDTEVRDEVYVWFRDHVDAVKKFLEAE